MEEILKIQSPGYDDSLAQVTINGEDLDMNRKTPNSESAEKVQKKPQGEASSVATLDPFIPNNNRRKEKRNYVPHPTLKHFDSIFGIENWSRYLTLRTEKKIRSGILENKLLNICPTAELSFRLNKPNEWLVEATTKKQSERILEIKEIDGINVAVTGHDTLNFIQGTVILPYIQDEETPNKNILLDSLKLRYNNVHDIEIFEIKSRKNQDIKLKIMKIKFIGQSLPLKI